MRRRVSLRVIASVVVLVLLLVGAGAGPVRADPPNPLPWHRQYVPEVYVPPYELTLEVAVLCEQMDVGGGLPDSLATGVPKVAVIGDSVQSQTWWGTYYDPLYRWRFATHCGETYQTAMDSGRLDHALAMQPDILVAGTGSNNYGTWWKPDPAKFERFPAVLAAYLWRTAGVRCRVLFNVAERPNLNDPPDLQAQWMDLHRRANALYASLAGQPGVAVIDWNAMVRQRPELLYDDQHLTRAGVNARINAALAAGRKCHPPDSPAGVRAVAGNGMASVSWTALPAEEGVTSYRVRSSLGHDVVTEHPTVNIAGLPNGTPVQFSVAARNASGSSPWTAWSTAVTPSGEGSRLHAVAPRRALDTRTGQGGKADPFWPAQSFTLSLAQALPPEAANAAAVVLNVTSTGQTHDTFLTVWPGGEGRPPTSNLNPRPGVEAAPAMATTRVGPDRTVQLFNNAGFTHVVVDVVGWYDQPGSGAGSLYVPVAPARVLDSRDGTGGKTTPFGTGQSHTLVLDQLPPTATAAVLNVTSTNTTRSGFVTVHPAGEARPLASSLNPQPSLTRANLTIAKLGAGRAVTVFNNTGATDVVIDLLGYAGAPGAADGGSEYFTMTPERHLDTRTGFGGITGPVSNASPRTIPFAGRYSVPATGSVVAVDANVTVVTPSQGGHTTVWPGGPVAATSTVNFLGGEVVANRSIVGLASGAARIWSTPTSVHYVVDVSGWFGPPIGTVASTTATRDPGAQTEG